jgi:hypothetical protein
VGNTWTTNNCVDDSVFIAGIYWHACCKYVKTKLPTVEQMCETFILYVYNVGVPESHHFTIVTLFALKYALIFKELLVTEDVIRNN